jgi:prepilin-type N-terminal cleavage/methylation domain-containing protein
MPALTRRGFTLTELLVSLVLLGFISAAMIRMLVTVQRSYQAQTQRVDLQQNIRGALNVFPSEFRELDAADGDIIAMSADSIRFRAMRQLAILCSPPVLNPIAPFATNVTVANLTMIVRAAPYLYQGPRNLDATRDDILIYYEGDEGSRSDDGWVMGDLTATSALLCPDGRPGERLTATLTFTNPQLNRSGAIQDGSPVRGYEIVTYKRYVAANGQSYIGVRVGATLRPLIGPVTANGLALRYFNAAGAITAVPAQVATIEVTVRAQTAQRVVRPGGGGMMTPVDSVVTRVALRNNRRF